MEDNTSRKRLRAILGPNFNSCVPNSPKKSGFPCLLEASILVAISLSISASPSEKYPSSVDEGYRWMEITSKGSRFCFPKISMNVVCHQFAMTDGARGDGLPAGGWHCR